MSLYSNATAYNKLLTNLGEVMENRARKGMNSDNGEMAIHFRLYVKARFS